MTKNQWRNLRVGARVTMKITNKVYNGTIIRINSNWSQVLVKWDGTKDEIWYGRLGIEILEKQDLMDKKLFLNKANNTIYSSNGNSNFTNLKTNQSGNLTNEQVEKYFVPLENYNNVFTKFQCLMQLVDVLQSDAFVEVDKLKLFFHFESKTFKQL
jgi:hypothetical protein